MFSKDSPLRSPLKLLAVIKGCGAGYRIDRSPAIVPEPRTPSVVSSEDVPDKNHTEHRKLAPGSQQSLSLLGPMLSESRLDTKPENTLQSRLLAGLMQSSLVFLSVCSFAFILIVVFGEPIQVAPHVHT